MLPIAPEYAPSASADSVVILSSCFRIPLAGFRSLIRNRHNFRYHQPLTLYLCEKTRRKMGVFASGAMLARFPLQMRGPRSGKRAVCPSIGCLSKFLDPHSVNSSVDHHLGMLAIADVATEDPRATLPANRLAGTPNRAYLGGR